MFRYLRVDIEPESAVNVFLRGRHFSQPALVLLHRLCLVRKNNLRGDHNREVDDDEFPQYSGEGGVGQVFQTNERIEEPADFQVLIEFVLDVYVRYLASRALVKDRGFWRPVRDTIIPERIERPLDFEEEVIPRHSRERHAGRLKRRFYSG